MRSEHEFIDFIPIPVLICDKSKVYDRNRACSKIIQSDSLRTEEYFKVFKDEDYQNIISKLNNTLVSGQPECIEHASLNVGGHVYDVSIHIDKVERFAENRVFVSLKDTDTDSKLKQSNNAKHKLMNQEKLAGIGHLAAGVAHEIFNPLGYIKSNFDTLNNYFNEIGDVMSKFHDLAEGCENKEISMKMSEIEQSYDLDFVLNDIKELFTDVDEGIGRVLSIVHGLKRFAHESDDLIEFDLNEGIKSTLIISKNEFKYDAVLEVEYGQLPEVVAHSGKINQVILGMIVNAVYAIREKHNGNMGKLSIKTFLEDQHACCTICDDGIGISQEKIDEIYNPFYTTKPEGVGTGLGLSIAWDIIVEQHGGLLDVESTVGEGTCFTIRLPITEE